MKKITVLFSLLLLSASAMAQQIPEAIYTLTETGVQPNSKFVDAFSMEEYKNITPYVKYKDCQISSRDKKYNYQIGMSKYRGWENDAGEANVIEISSGNSMPLTIKNNDAWLDMAKVQTGQLILPTLLSRFICLMGILLYCSPNLFTPVNHPT